tara:strand:- start:137069 stop:138433 length:1365 start_codon:yes stop_codon:yes gene_type:complete
MHGLNKNLKLHFIGVGGIGMSGIAEVLLNLGYKVSGSDLNKSSVIENLIKKGLEFHQGHRAENLKNVNIMIYSSAIKSENPEFQEAERLNIPIIKRAEMLAELMRLKFGIAIAGSHGKTTTTSMLATILSGLKLSPTFIVGGVVKNLGSNAGLGEGDILVAEADESDGSFHFLNPIVTVLTNIDNDHIDYYGSEEKLTESFVSFVNKVPFYGEIILNFDDAKIREQSDKFNRKHTTFGFDNNSYDYNITNYKSENGKAYFSLKKKEESYDFEIQMSGKHNVSNCVGAIIVAHKLKHSFESIQKALNCFEGVGRRLEKLYESENLLIIDDYAHHPTELEKTINSVINTYKDYKINFVFEPHRYSRTKNFWNDFVSVLTTQINTYILPIYPAGEDLIPYIDSELLVKQLVKSETPAKFINSINDLKIEKNSSEKTLFVFMGAGPISKNIREYIREL